jgi:hypothetical protein
VVVVAVVVVWVAWRTPLGPPYLDPPQGGSAIQNGAFGAAKCS